MGRPIGALWDGRKRIELGQRPCRIITGLQLRDSAGLAPDFPLASLYHLDVQSIKPISGKVKATEAGERLSYGKPET